MADSKLSTLPTGTVPDFHYGIQGGLSKKFNTARLINVRDFGAVGDGSTNDATAIQAAVNWSANIERGIIFFPIGLYQIGSSILFPSTIRAISFLGAAGAKIRGGFGDALLKRAVDSPFGGVYTIENLQFEQNSAAGKCIMFHSCVGAAVRNCALSSVGGTTVGIETYNSQAITLDSCSIIGFGVGVMAGNATSVIDCDITSCGEGIRHQNIGLTVLGGRYEANTIGIVVGKDQAGGNFQSQGFLISGLSMEQNAQAIYIVAGVAGEICGVSSGSGIAVSDGLYVNGGQNISVSACSFGSAGGFSGAAVNLQSATDITFTSVLAATWNIASGLASYQLINCNTEVTVAKLPTSARVGTVLPVSDATATTPGTTVVGGGSNHVAVVRSAGAWRII